MTLTDIASIGGLISGVAVLISLLYLNAQVRQAAKHTRAAMGQSYATRTLDFNYRLTDAPLADLVIKGRPGEELSETETFRFMAYTRATFWHVADTFYQHRDGLLDDDIFAGFERNQVGMMQGPGVHAAWTRSRNEFAPDFVVFMDRVTAEAATRGTLDFKGGWSAALAAQRKEP